MRVGDTSVQAGTPGTNTPSVTGVGRPAVAAVVVNWNTRELLEGTLVNLDAHLQLHTAPHEEQGPAVESVDFAPFDEVCVVDNGSVDGSVDAAQAEWPLVRFIRNEDNRGFCRASNQGIAATTAPYVLLINTDARLSPGCLDEMVRVLKEKADVAIVGPRLVYGDGTFQRWTAGRPLSLWTCATYFFLLDRLATRWPALSSMYVDRDTPEPCDVGWVSSAVMLVRRDAMDRFGLLDDGIFLYMDDVDLCDRALRNGYRVRYQADVTAVHFMGSSSARRNDGKASPEAIRSLIRWFTRRHGPAQGIALRAVVAGGFLLRWGLYAAMSVARPSDPVMRRKRAAHFANLSTVLKRIS